jgi:hypothetical protein
MNSFTAQNCSDKQQQQQQQPIQTVIFTYVETHELRRSSAAKRLVKVAHKGSGNLVGRHGDG